MNRGASIRGIRWFFPNDWHHIVGYRNAIAWHKQDHPDFVAPDWVELTDEQRANIRKANDQTHREMEEFADKLREDYHD